MLVVFSNGNSTTSEGSICQLVLLLLLLKELKEASVCKQSAHLSHAYKIQRLQIVFRRHVCPLVSPLEMGSLLSERECVNQLL